MGESEDEEEEDLVRFEDILSAASRAADALDVSMHNRNTNWPSHLVASFTRKRKRAEFSPESFETEYSSEPGTHTSIVSPEVHELSESEGSGRMHFEGELIIVLSSDSDVDSEVDVLST